MTELFEIALIVAAFLCSLVAGFLFAFAVVAMPGMKSLGDREFIGTFQAMDRVIQNNQPLFMVVWVGSVLAVVTAATLGVGQLDAADRLLIVATALAYLFGVQLPTITINIPLNNRLQALNVETMDEGARRTAREDFEPRWNQWNAIRTGVASLVSAVLLVLLFRL